MRATTFLFAAALAAGCTTQGMAITSNLDLVAPTLGPRHGDAGAGDMTLLVNGCPPLSGPVTTPDGGAGGDTWATYSQGFFASLLHALPLLDADRDRAQRRARRRRLGRRGDGARGRLVDPRRRRRRQLHAARRSDAVVRRAPPHRALD